MRGRWPALIVGIAATFGAYHYAQHGDAWAAATLGFLAGMTLEIARPE